LYCPVIEKQAAAPASGLKVLLKSGVDDAREGCVRSWRMSKRSPVTAHGVKPRTTGLQALISTTWLSKQRQVQVLEKKEFCRMPVNESDQSKNMKM
jgi:hypothetical protein